jgi:hypothetical protein
MWDEKRRRTGRKRGRRRERKTWKGRREKEGRRTWKGKVEEGDLGRGGRGEEEDREVDAK